MANELTLSASMVYDDSEDTTLEAVVNDLAASVSTKRVIHAKQNIGITEEAIGLGDVSAPGWAVFVNRDETNFIELRVATSGAKFAKLRPGEFAFLRLGAGAQAPYAIADTAACQLEYWIAAT